MRLVFFGTPELAVPSLEAVVRVHDVTALVCRPDQPRGRGRQVVPPPTKVWAQDHGIAVYQPTKLNDGGFERWLREQAPEVCALVAYGRIIKQPLLDVPRHGFINVHPSLLPRHRGPSPIQTALLEGDTITGVTIMRLDAGMDTGDMLLQEEMPIAPEDTGITLTERLAALGARMLVQALDAIERGEASYTPQDHTAATYCKMLSKADGRIDWSRPASRIHNLVRACLPWPVAQTTLGDTVLLIHETRCVDEPATGEPGTILCIERDAVVVATGEGALAITRVQPPGKKPMPMGDFLRGHRLAPGERFERT